MRARIWETLGLLGVLAVLGGWLVLVWSVAHEPPTRIERAVWNQKVYPWERPGAYQVRTP